MSELVKIHDIALASVLEPDEAAYYRKICREFSQTYHVPLPEVEKLPYDYVMRHHFEAQLGALVESDSDEAVAALDERMRRAIDPDYDENEEESIQEFIDMVEDEVAGRRKVKKKLIKNLKDNFPVMQGKEKGKDKLDKKRQSLDSKANLPPVTSGRRVFDEDPPQDLASGDDSGLDALNDLGPNPDDEEGGTELP